MLEGEEVDRIQEGEARVGCVRAWTPRVQRSLQDAALRELMAHRSTLGIPGTHPSAVRASGVNGSLHKLRST